MVVLIKNNKCVAKVETSTILFVEKDGRKLHVVTDSREYSYYEKLSNIEHLFDSTFFQCRKGCYINLNRVTIMEDQCVFFDNGMTYWLGRDSYIKTKHAYVSYLKKNLSRIDLD